MTSVAAEIEGRGERIVPESLDAEVRAAVERSFRRRFQVQAAPLAVAPAAT